MITINNEPLADYISFKLNKIGNKFTEEELKKLTEITFNPYDIIGDYFEINLDIIKEMPNLEKVNFFNLEIEKHAFSLLETLTKINAISFTNCIINEKENLKKLKVKELSIDNVENFNSKDIEGMDLTSIHLVNIKNVDLNDFLCNNNLSRLICQGCSITNFNSICWLKKIEVLYLDDTNILNLEPILSLNNLKILSIDKNQLNNNIDLIDKLQNKGITVYNEGIYTFNKIKESFQKK